MDNERESVRCEIVKLGTPTHAPKSDCWWCRQAPQCKCIDWRDIKIQKLILPKDEVIKHPIFYAGLAVASKATGESRREFVDYMTNILYTDKYRYFENDGITEFIIMLCTVSKAYNDEESYRWIRDFMETTAETRKLTAADSLLPRLKLITYTFMSVDFELIKHLENQALEDIRKKKSLKVQMIWCASFTEKNLRYDLEVINNDEVIVSIFENGNKLIKRVRLPEAPDKWEIEVAKSLNLTN